MQKIFLSLCLLTCLLFTQCKKNDDCPAPDTKAPDSEIASLQSYMDANSIVAVKDSRGFFYKINAAGGNDKPNNCSTVRVAYKGTLTNGSVFDQSSSASFLLSNLIVGWQQGIPLIGITGKITLYLPPTLAYGSTAHSGIPANSILIFDIELLGF